MRALSSALPPAGPRRAAIPLPDLVPASLLVFLVVAAVSLAGPVLAASADLKLMKDPPLSVGGIGDTFEFRISWSNFSAESAQNLVITDRIPSPAAYVPEALGFSLEGSSVPLTYGVDWWAAYSTDPDTAVPPNALFVTTPGTPPEGVYWLRWTIADVGVASSGTLAYRVRLIEKANDVLIEERGVSATMLTGGAGASVTYSATAKVLLLNPLVHIWKENAPTCVQTVGGMVTYRICFSNAGSNSAFNLQVLDRLASNSFWIPWTYSGWYVNLTGVPVAPDFYHCAGAACTSSSGPWTGPDPDGPPAWTWDDGTTPVYLRWVTGPADGLGIGRSGCITFTVSIG